MKREGAGISLEVGGLLRGYSWPGNIRELEHALEHAFVVCDQDTITTSHLPSQLKNASHTGASFPRGKYAIEPQAIVKALAKTAGNKKKAARLLGIDRKTLY